MISPKFLGRISILLLLVLSLITVLDMSNVLAGDSGYGIVLGAIGQFCILSVLFIGMISLKVDSKKGVVKISKLTKTLLIIPSIFCVTIYFFAISFNMAAKWLLLKNCFLLAVFVIGIIIIFIETK